MDALEFVNEFKRMCDQMDCSICPTRGDCEILDMTKDEREKLVHIVEEWSKTHPEKTRQSEFLKMFPHAKTLPSGILVCKPCEVDCGFEPNSNCSFGCNACRESYWLQEVE